MMNKVKNKNRCPTVTRQDNGSKMKVSAHWIIDCEGHGTCTKYKRGKCELDGEPCPFKGKKEFEVEYRWVSIYTEKYYLGGLHAHGILL